MTVPVENGKEIVKPAEMSAKEESKKIEDPPNPAAPQEKAQIGDTNLQEA